MIIIGIHADNKISERLEKYLLKDRNISREINLISYQETDEMLKAFEDKGDHPDLVFCDIVESSEVLKNIRRINNMVDIVILTPQSLGVGDIVLYHAFAILTYPVKLKSVKNIIEGYMDYRFPDKNIYSVTVNRELYDIDLDGIYYFESRKRIIYTHGQGETIHFYKTMRDLEKELSSHGFVRCHKSFLVNAKYVDEVHRKHIVVKGERIPVGRYYYEQGDGKIWRNLRKCRN